MKKIIRLSESDLTRIVKRVINENEQLNKMIKLSISRFISGLKMEDLDHDNIVFVNKKGKTVFRYDLEDGNLFYSTLLFSFVKGLKKSKPEDVHKNVSNIIESWAEENLIPKFSDEFENKFGFEFKIKNVDLGDEYIDDDEEEDDDEENYDEENYYVPNDRIYQKRNAYGPGNPNAKKKDSDPMEYLNSFNAHAYALSKKGVEIIISKHLEENLIPTDEFLPTLYDTHFISDINEIVNKNDKRKLNAFATNIEYIVQENNKSQTENIHLTPIVEPFKIQIILSIRITEFQ